MITLSVLPAQAQFRPDERIDLRIEVRGASPGAIQVLGRVLEGAPRFSAQELTFAAEVSVDSTGVGATNVTVEVSHGELAAGAARGFAVRIDEPVSGTTASTAFDIAAHWSSAPRYGFFADFSPTESVEETTARSDAMLALHLNVIQFYDWMLSHHTLVPETDVFIDPLDRELSKEVVSRKVAAAHERGMAAIAYGALYGAEHDFS